uniref:LIM zinc-binding domain-containing protein n=1 Tax=Mesocestoides corti TaxID=53468 RepID=A0A5K3EPX8_MESCO
MSNLLTFNLASRPDLLDINTEYADNLKFLLDQCTECGLLRSKMVPLYSTNATDTSKQKANSTTLLTKSGNNELPIPSVGTIPSETPAVIHRNHDLNAIPEEPPSFNVTPDSTSNLLFFSNINVKETARFFHTNFFHEDKNHPPQPVEIKTAYIEPNLKRSKSLSKRSLSARIQSLVDNFESSTDQLHTNSGSSSPESSSRNSEKRPTKPSSSEPSILDVKSSPETCFSCSKQIYPLDRVSAGFHVYHKSCLRCSVCGRNLSGLACETSNNQLFCRPHLLERVNGIY